MFKEVIKLPLFLRHWYCHLYSSSYTSSKLLQDQKAKLLSESTKAFWMVESVIEAKVFMWCGTHSLVWHWNIAHFHGTAHSMFDFGSSTHPL